MASTRPRDIDDVVGLSEDARRLYDWMIAAFTGDVNEALALAKAHNTSISRWTHERLGKAHAELKRRGVIAAGAPALKSPVHHASRKKTSAQLDREINEALGSRRGARGHATINEGVRRSDEITSTAGLMAIAKVVARELKQSGMTWGDTSRAQGRAVRIWSSGTSVRFEVPSRYQGYPSEAQAIVDLVLVGPDRSITRVMPFAGDQHYDKRFGEAMEQRVRQVLKKEVR